MEDLCSASYFIFSKLKIYYFYNRKNICYFFLPRFNLFKLLKSYVDMYKGYVPDNLLLILLPTHTSLSSCLEHSP